MLEGNYCIAAHNVLGKSLHRLSLLILPAFMYFEIWQLCMTDLVQSLYLFWQSTSSISKQVHIKKAKYSKKQTIDTAAYKTNHFGFNLSFTLYGIVILLFAMQSYVTVYYCFRPLVHWCMYIYMYIGEITGTRLICILLTVLIQCLAISDWKVKTEQNEHSIYHASTLD